MRIALASPPVATSVDDGLEQVRRCLADASSGGAAIVCFPEAYVPGLRGLDFDVPVVGEDVESLDEVDWLFWVGCAGAYEDRAKKTTRAVAELLDTAGVTFAVLGDGETCTGDSARSDSSTALRINSRSAMTFAIWSGFASSSSIVETRL